MKNVLLIIASCLLLCLPFISSSTTTTTNNQARYDRYRLYRLKFDTRVQVKVFQELEQRSDSYQFMGHAREIGQKLTILVAAHKVPEISDLLERYSVSHEILLYNFQELIDRQLETVKPITTKGADFDWKHYFQLTTIYDWLDELQKQYPDRINIINLGNSYEGRAIKGVKLSVNNNNIAANTKKSSIFIEAGIHAREWISPATATFILNQLLTSTDPAVNAVARNFDWFIVPVTNPDGYSYTFEWDRMWRKNRKPYGFVCRGVDLNRNFNCHWNHTGSSSDPCRYDFAGGSAQSEPESDAIAKFIQEHRVTDRIETFISLHSFSQLMMFPYGHSGARPRNYDDLLKIGEKAIEALAKRYGTKYLTGSINEIIYPSSGDSMDWAYAEANISVAYTIELRGPPTTSDLFILPVEQVEPTGWETLDAIVTLIDEANCLGYYDN